MHKSLLYLCVYIETFWMFFSHILAKIYSVNKLADFCRNRKKCYHIAQRRRAASSHTSNSCTQTGNKKGSPTDRTLLFSFFSLKYFQQHRTAECRSPFNILFLRASERASKVQGCREKNTECDARRERKGTVECNPPVAPGLWACSVGPCADGTAYPRNGRSHPRPHPPASGLRSGSSPVFTTIFPAGFISLRCSFSLKCCKTVSPQTHVLVTVFPCFCFLSF